MSCKIFQAEIKDRNWGATLNLTTRDHLDYCGECRKVHDEQTSLRILIGELEKVSAPADFEFRLRSRIASAERAGRTSFRERLKFSPNAVSIALASVFVLTSALTIHFAHVERADPGDSTTPAQDTATKKPVHIRAGASEESEIRSATQSVIEEPIVEQTAYHKRVTSQRRKSVAGQTVVARNAFSLTEVQAESGFNTMGVTIAPVINAQAAVSIPVSGGVEPISLILKNERGEAQRVSIKSVSFGTQEFVGRFNNLAHESSIAREGVW